MLKRKHYKEDIKKICNLFLTLLLLLVGVETTNAAVETFDFTKMRFSNQEVIKEVKGNNINITFNAIPTAVYVPNWNSKYSSVEVYGYDRNSFTIATNHPNYLIWRIVITFLKNGSYVLKEGSKATDGNGTYSSKDNVTTWIGASDSVTFTNKTASKWWIKKIEVSYSIGGNGQEESDPYTVGDINTFFYIGVR